MNEFMVGVQGESITLLRPVPLRLSADQAVRLAAWLVAMSEPLNGGGQAAFERVYKQVCSG